MMKKRKSLGATVQRTGKKSRQSLKSKQPTTSDSMSERPLDAQKEDISTFKNIHESLLDVLQDFSLRQPTPIQDGLFSLFDEADESLSASDLHIHTRDHSGKTIGYLLFILNRRLRECGRPNSMEPKGENRIAIILVPDMNRLQRVTELLSACAVSLQKKGIPINIVPFMKHQQSSILDAADHTAETFLITTPAVFFAAANSERDNFPKIVSRTHTLVFDKADEMQSDFSITKLSAMIRSAVAPPSDEALNQTPQIILVSACYTKNVLHLKQVLRTPLVLTLEMSVSEEGSDPVSALAKNENSATVRNSVGSDTNDHPDGGEKSLAPPDPRVVNHWCLHVGKLSERYTWVYAIIKHHFERFARRAAKSDCPKIVITVSDIQSSYKLKIFLEELGVQNYVFHQFLAKNSKEKLIKALSKKTSSVVILVENALPSLVDAAAQASKLESSFLSLATHIVSMSRASADADPFMSTYRLTHEYFARHSSPLSNYPAVTEMITMTSVKEDESLVRKLGGYIQQHSPGNGGDQGNSSIGISESYMKSYQYRCEDVFYTQCTPKRVKRETAKSISKEIQIVEGAASGRKRRLKREKTVSK